MPGPLARCRRAPGDALLVEFQERHRLRQQVPVVRDLVDWLRHPGGATSASLKNRATLPLRMRKRYFRRSTWKYGLYARLTVMTSTRNPSKLKMSDSVDSSCRTPCRRASGSRRNPGCPSSRRWRPRGRSAHTDSPSRACHPETRGLRRCLRRRDRDRCRNTKGCQSWHEPTIANSTQLAAKPEPARPPTSVSASTRKRCS